MLFPENIDKTEIANLPLTNHTGEIIVIDNAKAVAEAVQDLMECPLLGFDTETKPSFKKGEHNKVSLLQLATTERCYLFRLHLIGPNTHLKKILESEEVRKVGLSVHDDFRALNRWMPVNPSNFIELQRYVKYYGINEMSLQKIYAIVLKHKISKRQQLSNWEAPILTDAQQLYAATDAWACRDIYFELQRSIERL